MVFIVLLLARDATKLIFLKSLPIVGEYLLDPAPLRFEVSLLFLLSLVLKVLVNLKIDHHDHIYQDEGSNQSYCCPPYELPYFKIGHEVCEKQKCVSDQHVEYFVHQLYLVLSPGLVSLVVVHMIDPKHRQDHVGEKLKHWLP